MKTIWTTAVILGLAALTWAQPLATNPPPPGAVSAPSVTDEPPHPCMMEPPVPQAMPGFARLGLTDEQKEKLEQLQMALVKQTAPLEADVRVRELELASLWRAEKLDAKAIVAKVKEIAEVKTKLEIARVTNRIDSYNLLTPEQQKQVRKMLLRGAGRNRIRQHHGGQQRLRMLRKRQSD